MSSALQRILETAAPVFLIMDPLGNVPACLALLGGLPPARRRVVLFRELCLALALMLLFFFVGKALLELLGLEQSALRVAGGVILFIISLRMIYPDASDTSAAASAEEPFLTPIATPLVAGPSLLATVMVTSTQGETMWPSLAGMLLAWAAASSIMLAGAGLAQTLGPMGVRAMVRLMGLVLVLLAVQMIQDGVRLFVESL